MRVGAKSNQLLNVVRLADKIIRHGSDVASIAAARRVDRERGSEAVFELPTRRELFSELHANSARRDWGRRTAPTISLTPSTTRKRSAVSTPATLTGSSFSRKRATRFRPSFNFLSSRLTASQRPHGQRAASRHRSRIPRVQGLTEILQQLKDVGDLQFGEVKARRIRQPFERLERDGGGTRRRGQERLRVPATARQDVGPRQAPAPFEPSHPARGRRAPELAELNKVAASETGAVTVRGHHRQ